MIGMNKRRAMEILCNCGHSTYYHGNKGCIVCECLLSVSVIEARYWAIKMMKERDSQARIRKDLLDTYWSLAGEYILASREAKNNANFIASMQKEDYELREQLRMCQYALKTMDQAQIELASYTKIAIDALKKIAPNNTEHVNFGIAQDALDKIKGKF